MGFFDYIMKGIGFETTGGQLKKPAASAGAAPVTATPQSFSLPVYQPEAESEVVQPAATASSPASQTPEHDMAAISKNVIVYNPKNQKDIKNLIDFLRRKEPIIVNFALLPQDVAGTMISFISGALYALRGSIHPIAGNLYLLTPEGVNILVPKEK